MGTLFNAVRCLKCNHKMEPDLSTTECSKCGSDWLEACYDLDSVPANWRASLTRRPANMWRYRELLPFRDGFEPITMSEGWTPLIRAERLERESQYNAGGGEIWIKDERRQPTGSFKDREAAFAVNAIRLQGIKELVLASTGNKAAAYAAYCARAGIKLWVFLPSSVPAEKMRELGLYGAEVVKVTGTYDQAKEIAADFAARHGTYLDKGAKAIPGKESMKTIAFEIAEQLGWESPDWYVQAVSGGLGPIGVIKGFAELCQAGLIDHAPKLGIVQVEGCAPMVRAWEQGLAQAEPTQPDTLITVLATGQPGFAYEILKQATDRYGGAMVAVSDGEAFRAMRHIARSEGLSVEPAASVAFAGLRRLLAEGHIEPGERVLVNCSGHTFSAEKHALEDRYALLLKIETPVEATSVSGDMPSLPKEGLITALEQLDEQITTIVVIEDNPHHSRLIRRLLQSYKHYRVFEAYDGLDGLDLVRQRRPDLVILDLAVPGLDGLSILGELKADDRTCEIPIVVVSAKSLSPDEWHYLRRYAQSVWQKGRFSPRALVDHVVGVVGDDVGCLQVSLPGPIHQMEESGMSLAEYPAQVFEGSHRPRILVVDDHMSDARLMRRLFEVRQRFEVVEAHSGAETLAAIEQGTPDLIILDLLLPDIGGEELLEMIRTRDDTRETPVIVVSAKDLGPALRARLARQADSVWSKAVFDRSDLLAHVEAILSD
jgi:threonine synthase